MVAAIKSVLTRPVVHRVAVIQDMNFLQPTERLVISLKNQKLVKNKHWNYLKFILYNSTRTRMHVIIVSIEIFKVKV